MVLIGLLTEFPLTLSVATPHDTRDAGNSCSALHISCATLRWMVEYIVWTTYSLQKATILIWVIFHQARCKHRIYCPIYRDMADRIWTQRPSTWARLFSVAFALLRTKNTIILESSFSCPHCQYLGLILASYFGSGGVGAGTSWYSGWATALLAERWLKKKFSSNYY